MASLRTTLVSSLLNVAFHQMRQGGSARGKAIQLGRKGSCGNCFILNWTPSHSSLKASRRSLDLSSTSFIDAGISWAGLGSRFSLH